MERQMNKTSHWTIMMAVFTVCLITLGYFGQRFWSGLKNDAKQLGRDIDEVLHITPEIKLKEFLLVERTAPTFEIATVECTAFHETRWTHEWMKSEKWIHVKGYFKGKAGFNCAEYFNLVIGDDNQGHRRVTVYMPKPKLLSVEQLPGLDIQSENGWVNKISDNDRAQVLNEFSSKVRERMTTEQDILGQAERNFEAIITKLVSHRLGDETVVKFEHTEPPKG